MLLRLWLFLTRSLDRGSHQRSSSSTSRGRWLVGSAFVIAAVVVAMVLLLDRLEFAPMQTHTPSETSAVDESDASDDANAERVASWPQSRYASEFQRGQDQPSSSYAATPRPTSRKSTRSLEEILTSALEPDATAEQRRDAANLNLACLFAPADEAELAQASRMRVLSEAVVRRWYDEVCDLTTGLIDPSTAREWWGLSLHDPDEAQLLRLIQLLQQAKDLPDAELERDTLDAIEWLILNSVNPAVIRQGAIVRAASTINQWRLGEAQLYGTVWWMHDEHRRQYQQVWSEILACHYANDCDTFGARTIGLCRDHAVCHEGQTAMSVLRLIFPPALFHTADLHVDRFRANRGY